MKKILLLAWMIFQLSAFSLRPSAFGEEALKPLTEEEPKFVGSFFDTKVPEQNYFFVKSVVAVFGNKFGKQPENTEEMEEAIWDQLLMSYEAFRRGIIVNQEEVDGEVNKILQAEGVPFDWKVDKEAYEKWLKEKANEPPALFENQIRHMIQLRKLKEDVIESLDPSVTDGEAFEGFLNENSSLDVELIQFDIAKDADNFYNKVRSRPAAWEKEKSKRPKDFRKPGGVTCQFLIDFWNIPGRALQEMVKMKPGQFHKPEPIYKGWGVFKVLGSTAADESKFDGVKERYRDKVKAGKKYEAFNTWFEQLKKDAKIEVYPPSQTEASPKKEEE